MLMKVNGKTQLGDILRYPQFVDILQEAGLQLLGCSLPLDMSLKRFFKTQGFSSDLLDESLAKINETIEELYVELDSAEINGAITITDYAADKINSYLESKGKSNSQHGLRITVVPGGCSGYQYYLKIDEPRPEWDTVFDNNSAKVIVAKADIPVLKDAVLDFQESLMVGGGGFMIDNPNAKSTCACGKSFG